jgi:hypothetical protein
MTARCSGVKVLARLGLGSAASLAAVGALLGCGGGEAGQAGATRAGQAAPATQTPATTPAPPPPPPPPPLSVRAPGGASGAWRVFAAVHGHRAAWLAQRSGVTLMRFDQRYLHLNLHAGSGDGGTVGWRYGDRVSPREVHHLVAGFNGGFKLSYPQVGFISGGHVAAPLRPGLASIVTYADGSTDIGTWRAGVPSGSSRVFSVLQNQRLLVDGGVPTASPSGCVQCWGETIGGRSVVARSALGIASDGRLIWAAGMELLPWQLARALARAGAVRAIELDINPDWVAGYLYLHHPTGPSAVPVIPGQQGIAGQLLEPYARDFLTIVA